MNTAKRTYNRRWFSWNSLVVLFFSFLFFSFLFCSVLFCSFQFFSFTLLFSESEWVSVCRYPFIILSLDHSVILALQRDQHHHLSPEINKTGLPFLFTSVMCVMNLFNLLNNHHHHHLHQLHVLLHHHHLLRESIFSWISIFLFVIIIISRSSSSSIGLPSHFENAI